MARRILSCPPAFPRTRGLQPPVSCCLVVSEGTSEGTPFPLSPSSPLWIPILGAEDEMVEWYHQFHGHELRQTLGGSEGQGGLVCCSPWGCKELGMT